MPADFIKKTLDPIRRISEVKIISNQMLSFKLDNQPNIYTVYTPSSEEYLVSSDVVAKAIDLGANLIICEPWCNVTGEGYQTGHNNRVSVYPIKTFLSKIYNNEQL